MERDATDRNNPFYTDSERDTGRSESIRSRIDFARADFPKPWLINNQRVVAALEKRYEVEVAAIEQVVGRPLSSTELEGMAYWSCKEVQVRSRSLPLGFLGGAYRAYTTSNDFRFPFWKPGERFDPNVVRVFGTSVVQGQLARAFWHTGRYAAYSLLAGPIITGIFTSSWAVSVANTGRLRDPRTKPLFEAIVAKGQQAAQQLRQETMSNRNSRQPLPSSSATSFDPNSPTNNGYSEVFPPDNDSDRSQSSQDPSGFAPYEKSASTSSSASSYMPMSTNERRFSQENPETNSTYQPPKNDNESSSFFDNNYDDASPTASYPSPSSSEGSAWDKIRAGKSANPDMLPREQRANRTRQAESSVSTEVDSRSQAQKEFDASLERERQGKNFD